MGHYDSCYEGTRRSDEEKALKRIEESFTEQSKNLTPYQKSFIVTIMKDVEKWMIFVDVIKNLK